VETRANLQVEDAIGASSDPRSSRYFRAGSVFSGGRLLPGCCLQYPSRSSSDHVPAPAKSATCCRSRAGPAAQSASAGSRQPIHRGEPRRAGRRAPGMRPHRGAARLPPGRSWTPRRSRCGRATAPTSLTASPLRSTLTASNSLPAEMARERGPVPVPHRPSVLLKGGTRRSPQPSEP
jgi:hypothetical protein